MKACTMDWKCECGVSVTNVPLIGLNERDVPLAAIGSHREIHPCEMVLKAPHVEAIQQFGNWDVMIGL